MNDIRVDGDLRLSDKSDLSGPDRAIAPLNLIAAPRQSKAPENLPMRPAPMSDNVAWTLLAENSGLVARAW